MVLSETIGYKLAKGKQVTWGQAIWFGIVATIIYSVIGFLYFTLLETIGGNPISFINFILTVLGVTLASWLFKEKDILRITIFVMIAKIIILFVLGFLIGMSFLALMWTATHEAGRNIALFF